MFVLVVFDPKTDEVAVRGPWESEEEGNGAARAVARQHTDDDNPPRLAVVGVTPMVYFDPLVHRGR